MSAGPDSRSLAPESRAFTDAVLADLAADRWRPRAWLCMLDRVSRRSLEQIAARPRAAAEVTALHVAFALATRDSRGRAWTMTSWALAITHLGMLEGHSGLGAANALTLLRANLPAILPDRPALAGAIAVATDIADGQISRRTGTTTLFGQQADALTDAAVWTWLALRHEPSRALKLATLGGWAAVVGSVTIASFAKGGMIDPPRPKFIRPSAAMQAVLTARAAWRLLKRP